MADPLFGADLPGAPPASDTEAWAPGGTPAPSSPPASPDQARPVDVDTLTPVQRHALRQAIRSGDQADYDKFEAMLASPNAGGSDADGPPPDGTGGPPPPDDGPPAASSELNPEIDPDFAARLEASGLGPEAFDHIAPGYEQFSARLQTMTDDEAVATVLDGEAEVLRAHYKGSEAAMREGVADIKKAAEFLDLDLAAIDASGALADPVTHWRALCLARYVLGRQEAAA